MLGGCLPILIAVILPGKDERPTISGQYLRGLYASPAPEIDLGTFVQSAAILLSDNLYGFHFDVNGLMTEQQDDKTKVRRAQFAETLSISHPLGKYTISGEVWHFAQPLTHSTRMASPGRKTSASTCHTVPRRVPILEREKDAQDIHQEAFLKVYKKLDGFRFECSFRTWIYRIVTNVCLDHLRRNQARKKMNVIEITDDDLLNQVSDDRPGNNPEQQLLDRELGAHISKALQGLTPRERMVFDLRYFEGLKLQSVSEILNASEGSIKMTFFRATRKLRLQLGKYTKRHRSSVNKNIFSSQWE
jgi:RNA polymerase sigma factor (sigma-70 family)